MTTFSYTLVLNDSEVIMLQAALEMMLAHCEHQLRDGPKAPYIAWQMSAKSVLSQLYDEVQITSHSVPRPNQ
jgi:hypothetical protein